MHRYQRTLMPPPDLSSPIHSNYRMSVTYSLQKYQQRVDSSRCEPSSSQLSRAMLCSSGSGSGLVHNIHRYQERRTDVRRRCTLKVDRRKCDVELRRARITVQGFSSVRRIPRFRAPTRPSTTIKQQGRDAPYASREPAVHIVRYASARSACGDDIHPGS